MKRDVVRAAAVGIAFTLLFLWVFAQPILDSTYLSTTDLFDYYLPSFLSPPLVWSSYEYAGTPVFADPEGSPHYPLRRFFADVAGSWTGFLVAGYVLGACTLYAYVHHLTRSAAAGAVAGLAFALSEAMLERLPHPTIVHAIAWVPLILLAIDGVCDPRRRWVWAAIGGLATSNCLLAGHPQLPLYAGYLCAAYACCNLFQHRSEWRTWAAMAVIPASGLMLAAVSLLPLAEVSAEAERQIVRLEDFVSYANTLPQMLSIAFPRVVHPGLESPTYVGLGVLILAPLGVAQFRSNWRVAFWTIAVIVALLLGVGAATPLGELARTLPFYERFRIVSRHLVFAGIGLSVLAGFAIARIQQGSVRLRTMVWSSAPAIVLVVGGALAIERFPDVLPLDPFPQAGWLLARGSGVAAPVALLVCSLVACVAFWRYQRSVLASGLLLTVLGVDLLSALPWSTTPTGLAFETLPRQVAEPSVHVERLRAQLVEHHQRLLIPGGARGNEVVAGGWARLWRIPLATGYSSVHLRRMSHLLPPAASGRFEPRLLQPQNVVLDLLAVRSLLIAADANERAMLRRDPQRWREVERFSTSLVSDWDIDEVVPGETEYVVFENVRARPRAWMTAELLPVTDGILEDAIATSQIDEGRPFDPATTALVDQEGVQARTYDPGPRSAVVESIEDSAIRVRAASATGGFLVLSEAYYPGWHVRIGDGPPQPVVRTYLALQGIEVPPGEHLVTFEFVPDSRRAGLQLSAAGCTLILLCAVASFRQS